MLCVVVLFFWGGESDTIVAKISCGAQSRSQASIGEVTLHLEGPRQINNYHREQCVIKFIQLLLTLRFLRLPSSSFKSPADETGAVSVFFLSSGVTASVFLVD